MSAKIWGLNSRIYFSDVGQSRTIEIMDSICDKEEANETAPLLKRDYISFNVRFQSYGG